MYAINLSTGAGSTLYAFKGGTKDGNLPSGNLVASKGELYGATLYGGSTGCHFSFQKFGCGTLFAVKASTGAEKVLYKYPKNDTSDSPSLYPEGGIIYGTQYDGLFTWAP